MRPVRLEFEGFTAFRDPTVVDFVDADLFALTGPTGSGKTSVLDAIVFALYGTVPRLADQRAVAPIIAQGMAQARIRLDFTVGVDEYTATRVVRRTKTGATTPEARLEAAGEVLAGNADEVTARVGEVLGLSYEHFTKCVVLPQGEFARFLHDKPKDRQELLVSLLDLGVYGRMAELAGRRRSNAASQVAVLEGRLGDLANATPDAVALAAARLARLTSLVAQLDAAMPELAALDVDLAEANAASERLATEAVQLGAITIPSGLDALHDRLQAAAVAAAAADAEVRAAEAAQQEAEASRAAMPDHTELLRLRDNHDRCEALVEQLAKCETVVAERKADEAVAGDELLAAERHLAEAREAEEAVVAADHAHALRADLVAGEPCPVCLQEVRHLPKKEKIPALDACTRRRKKAEATHSSALRAHSAAQQATTAAVTTETHVAAELDSVKRTFDGQPTRADTLESLELVEAASRRCDETAKAADTARRSLRAAAQARDVLSDEEVGARQQYDTTRDAVAALDPPTRLGRDAALLDEWRSLVDWAARESAARSAVAAEQSEKATAIAGRRVQRLVELVHLCRAEEVIVANGEDPVGTAREALGKATAEHVEIAEDAATAERLRADLKKVESRREVAHSLATHLDARHFEKWILDEALSALAEGATDVLSELSCGQYALRVDSKTGGFAVVDHRNAGELRTARTLSGGETFLASLALALALADRIAVLAAHGVARLESIFLDEGFGTLDSDTLDVVASAIEELGASGRLVGVVSHVEDLAERMPVRFEVSRTGNTSTIERVDR
jgi:exonuclease SbcC